MGSGQDETMGSESIPWSLDKILSTPSMLLDPRVNQHLPDLVRTNAPRPSFTLEPIHQDGLYVLLFNSDQIVRDWARTFVQKSQHRILTWTPTLDQVVKTLRAYLLLPTSSTSKPLTPNIFTNFTNKKIELWRGLSCLLRKLESNEMIKELANKFPELNKSLCETIIHEFGNGTFQHNNEDNLDNRDLLMITARTSVLQAFTELLEVFGRGFWALFSGTDQMAYVRKVINSILDCDSVKEILEYQLLDDVFSEEAMRNAQIMKSSRTLLNSANKVLGWICPLLLSMNESADARVFFIELLKNLMFRSQQWHPFAIDVLDWFVVTVMVQLGEEFEGRTNADAVEDSNWSRYFLPAAFVNQFIAQRLFPKYRKTLSRSMSRKDAEDDQLPRPFSPQVADRLGAKMATLIPKAVGYALYHDVVAITRAYNLVTSSGTGGNNSLENEVESLLSSLNSDVWDRLVIDYGTVSRSAVMYKLGLFGRSLMLISIPSVKHVRLQQNLKRVLSSCVGLVSRMISDNVALNELRGLEENVKMELGYCLVSPHRDLSKNTLNLCQRAFNVGSRLLTWKEICWKKGKRSDVDEEDDDLFMNDQPVLPYSNELNVDSLSTFMTTLYSEYARLCGTGLLMIDGQLSLIENLQDIATICMNYVSDSSNTSSLLGKKRSLSKLSPSICSSTTSVRAFWNIGNCLWKLVSAFLDSDYKWARDKSCEQYADSIIDGVTKSIQLSNVVYGFTKSFLLETGIIDDSSQKENLGELEVYLLRFIYHSSKWLKVKQDQLRSSAVSVLVRVLKLWKAELEPLKMDKMNHAEKVMKSVEKLAMEEEGKSYLSSAQKSLLLDAMKLETVDVKSREPPRKVVVTSKTVDLTREKPATHPETEDFYKKWNSGQFAGTSQPTHLQQQQRRPEPSTVAPSNNVQFVKGFGKREVDLSWDAFNKANKEVNPSFSTTSANVKPAYSSSAASSATIPKPVGKVQQLRAESRRVNRAFPGSSSTSVSSSSTSNSNNNAFANRKRQNTRAGTSSSEDDNDDDMSGLMELARDVKRERRQIKVLDLPVTSTTRGARLLNARSREDKPHDEIKEDHRELPGIDYLHKQMLQWDVQRLVRPREITDKLQKVPDVFTDVHHYATVFEPLIVLEVWEQLWQALEEVDDRDVIDMKVREAVGIDEFYDITFVADTKDVKIRSFSENDVVRLEKKVSSSSSSSSSSASQVLGKIQSVVSRRDESVIIVRIFGRVEITSQLNIGSVWLGLRLFSLTTTHREYGCLASLKSYGLLKEIMRPIRRQIPRFNDIEVGRLMSVLQVNKPQAKAIFRAKDQESGFVLIQGPPGTGKTKTILALIGSIITAKKPNYIRVPDTNSRHLPPPAPNKNHILCCAPSNAAIDEIVRRLKHGVPGIDGKKYFPAIVRLGATEAVHPDAKDVLLETMVEEELAGEAHQQLVKNSDSSSEKERSVRTELNTKRQERDELKSALHYAADPLEIEGIEAQLRDINDVISDLVHKVEDQKMQRIANRSIVEDARIKVRERILAKAEVILSTLSASGHDILGNLKYKFSTVIVDEACQCVELSTLIPLKYGAKKCILVGDPNQLPPTVLSQVAQEYQYEQSLFQRILKSDPSGVNLLSIQYRMHPEISRFPSDIFYDSKLNDGIDNAKKCSAPWHVGKDDLFSPYRFFNVRGKEMRGKGRSLYNPDEIDAALRLVGALCRAFPEIQFAHRIGIITPYQLQCRELRNAFRRRFGQNIGKFVDINTVDGFQGREKDIIILSCVRASHDSGIGFLSDIRRMNVALTRARCSVWILGNCKSLESNEYWGKLLEDARRRDKFRELDNVTIPSWDGVAPTNLMTETYASPAKKSIKGVVARSSGGGSKARGSGAGVPSVPIPTDLIALGSSIKKSQGK